MIPEWVIKLLPFLKSDEREDFKAITTGFKDLNNDYRAKITEQEKRIKELEDMQGKSMNQKDLEILLEREKEYHQQLIELMSENRDLKEYIIFRKFIKNGE